MPREKKRTWTYLALVAVGTVFALSAIFILNRNDNDTNNRGAINQTSTKKPFNQTTTSDRPTFTITIHTNPDTIFDIPELTRHVDLILIGEVGGILGVEYSELNNRDSYTDEEWNDLLAVDPYFYTNFQTVFTEITPIEVFKGEIYDKFPITRGNPDNYRPDEFTSLSEGDAVLFFLVEAYSKSETAQQFKTVYTPWGENGIFTIEDNKALTGMPYAFRNNDSSYYHELSDQQAYFELDKLIEEVSNIVREQEREQDNNPDLETKNTPSTQDDQLDPIVVGNAREQTTTTTSIVTGLGCENNDNLQGNIHVSGFSFADAFPNLPELISKADAILIGEVGKALACEYPSKYQREAFAYPERVVFKEITTVEVLKGSVPDRFPLLATDVEYYASINLKPIKEGEVILFFISIEKGDPNYARSYDTFYEPLGEAGVFDVEDNHAFPRQPVGFRDNNEPYYNRTNPSRPFIELDKLREVIAAADK